MDREIKLGRVVTGVSRICIWYGVAAALLNCSRRDIVSTCFHPAKWNRVDGRDKRNLHARWMACGMDGIGAQGTVAQV